MKEFTPFETWYGRDGPPPAVIKLRAGRLTVEFEGSDLRYIRFADKELVRRIYVAIRDVNWNTIPASLSNLVIDSAEDHFQIEFDAAHKEGTLEFNWHGIIEGHPDGTIAYTMQGKALGEFRFCRIGFCLLHPIEGIAGSNYKALTPSGLIQGELPVQVAPQRMENGFEAPMFPSCSSLTIRLPEGIDLTADFEGDLFEMEDQRNWTDGSFKTYCTPLSQGYPHLAKAGQAIEQRITIRASMPEAALTVSKDDEDKPIQLTFTGVTGLVLPKIGFGITDHGEGWGRREAELLAKLHPDHLKVEIHLSSHTWIDTLNRAVMTAKEVGSPLELAIFLPDHPEAELEELSTQLQKAPLARVIIFNEAEASKGTTSPGWIKLARKYLQDVLPGILFVGGTNGNFAELNRQPPDIAAMDGVSYTINPQVHARDERSLIEAIEAQGDTVRTARSYSGRLPISISSVTLRPPFNQSATEAEGPTEANVLPEAVDPRQMSLFAAAWAIGSLRSLSAGEADTITYFEASGWRGLLEAPGGSPLPDKFRSYPGMIFPVYYVFSFLAGYKEANLARTRTEYPLRLECAAFKKDGYLGVMIANLQPRPQEVRMSSFPAGEAVMMQLNEITMPQAAADPEALRKRALSLAIRDGQASHIFAPYESVFLEIRLP